MNKFLEYLIGEFHNKRQAFSHPTRYAYIRVLHRKFSDELIYGEQAYAFNDVRPYRQFVLKPIVEGDTIRIINYEIDNKLRFVKGANLDQITEKDLIFRSGCDIIFKENDGVFYGEVEGCECFVEWRGQQTYVKNKVELGLNYYNVVDKGMLVGTEDRIWGSEHGAFEFRKMPN